MSFEQERNFAESLAETPSVLRYSDILKVGTPIADMNYHTLIPSNGGSFSANQMVRIPFNIPTDSFANLKGAYIKFKINNADSSNAVALDPIIGGAAVIDTFRIVSGTGALLEEIIHYNAIYSLMNDMVSVSHRESNGNIMEGSAETPLNGLGLALGGTGANNVASDPTTNVRGLIPASGSKTITHVPMSGFFQCDRLAPLGFATGTSTIELVLAQENFPLTFNNDASSPNTAWTISEVELHVPVLRMGSEFNASFRQLLSSGIPINWHSTSYHNVQTNVPVNAGGADTTLTVSTRKRSVKSIFTLFRKTADLTDLHADSASCRRSLGISRYRYTIGGVQMPHGDIKVSGTDLGEAYATLTQCLSNLGNVYASTCMNNDNYRLAVDQDGASGQATASKIAYGLDLESYGHSDVQSGKNLSNQGLPIVFNGQLGTGTTSQASTASCLCDMYLLYDVVYSLDGVSGTITANM
tara:strand:+ start:3833 stop:5242 length:1410 start_codon:yes stop_codon:yes gene_type:complete